MLIVLGIPIDFGRFLLDTALFTTGQKDLNDLYGMQ